jgi:hypothetical protein
MTDPLEGVTDAHIQAALDQGGYAMTTVQHVRAHPAAWPHIIAHARTIAANEKLTAELAELRAKYEPAPVDPVKVEAEKMYRNWISSQGSNVVMLVEKAIRRGMEMQPAPFTQEEAKRIAKRLSPVVEGGSINDLIFNAIRITLTTPHAELLAMLGDG